MNVDKGTIVVGQAGTQYTMKTVEINGFPLEVEVADNDQKRMQGLQYRRAMPEDKGMLFVFDNPTPEVEMHMVNVQFPIEMIFVDPAGIITKVYKAKPGEKGIKAENVLHVIEAPEGWCDKRGVTEGGKTNLADERTIDVLMLRSKVDEFPIEVELDGNKFKMYIVNDKQYVITCDGCVITSTNDTTGTLALADMFTVIYTAWLEQLKDKTMAKQPRKAKLESQQQHVVEEGISQQADKALFQSMMQYFIDKSTMQHKEEMKRFASVLLGKPWDKRD